MKQINECSLMLVLKRKYDLSFIHVINCTDEYSFGPLICPPLRCCNQSLASTAPHFLFQSTLWYRNRFALYHLIISIQPIFEQRWKLRSQTVLSTKKL